MTIQTIGGFTIERALASYGLKYFAQQVGVKQDYKVYGCGSFRPGEKYDDFVEAYSNGELLGIVGLTINEEILAVHEPALRQLLGHVLMKSRKIFTTDPTSAEWAPHYDIQGVTHGGHPAWLAPIEDAEKVLADYFESVRGLEESVNFIMANDENTLIVQDLESGTNTVVGIIARDLGSCMLGTILGQPTIIWPDVGRLGFKQNAIGNHPLVRFAQRFGVMQNVALDHDGFERCYEAMREHKLKIVNPQLVEAAKIEAHVTMEKMLPQSSQPALQEGEDQVFAALSVFGDSHERVVAPDGKSEEQPVAFAWGNPPTEKTMPEGGTMPKVVSPGDSFDPATHYGPYYYADGPGMVYTNPSGEKTRYSGPGRDWEGFDTVADIFKMIFRFPEKTPTMVSLGCGFGSDVLRFLRKGWDAWGCDISKWSVEQAPPGVRDRIILGNICHRSTQSDLPKHPQLVCTFDFWEHIFLQDIDVLLTDLAKWMPSGSFMANIICTTGRNEKDITIGPDDGFTLENSWFLISGHVTGRRWHWWANKFHEHGFNGRLDLCHMFQVARTEDAAMSQSMSWRPRNLLIVER